MHRRSSAPLPLLGEGVGHRLGPVGSNCLVEIFAFVSSAKGMSCLAEKVAKDSKGLESHSIHSFLPLTWPKHLSDRPRAAGLPFQTFSALPPPPHPGNLLPKSPGRGPTEMKREFRARCFDV